MFRTIWPPLAFLVALATTASCTGSAYELAQIPISTPTLTPTPSLVVLPQDDAPHPDVTTEWWYYNGHLKSQEGLRYAFHYVVFQVTIPDQPSFSIAHLSISDPQQRAYTIGQRVSLTTLQPSEAQGFAFDLNGWRMSGYDGQDSLLAFTSDYALDLELQTEGQPVLHGGTGLVDFGQGTTSYYYSRTRLEVTGALTFRGAEASVTGLAWFDHQWGNFSAQAVGWDWFALQLADGSDLMLTLLRDEGGEPLHSYGTFVATDGAISSLAAEELMVTAAGSWASPTSNATYPMGWRIQIPGRGVDVTLTPLLPASEFDATTTTLNYYWEGQVTVSGSHGGEGFVEMTGYTSPKLPGE